MLYNVKLKKIINDAIYDFLKQGKIPSHNIINEKINKEKEYKIEEPYFRGEVINFGNIASSRDMNLFFEKIKKDLVICFEENNLQQDDLLLLINYYEIEKNKILSKIEKINYRIDNINKYKNNLIYSDIIENKLDTFYDIDLDNTSCMIDLNKQKAYNYSTDNKLKLEYENLDLNLSGTTINEFDMALYDVASDSWKYIVESTENELELIITLTLNKQININSVLYLFTSYRNTDIKLALSEDGIKYTDKINTKIQKGYAEWNFDDINVKYIRFYYKKNEQDSLNNFIFNAQNISIYKRTYKDKQIFTSKRYTVNNINRVKLNKHEQIFTNSKINYWIKYNEKYFKIEEILEINEDIKEIQLVAQFINGTHSPQLLDYNLIIWRE